MADHLEQTARSALMSRIRGKDTSPEVFVRRLVYALGYRYRLHDRDLPGCPDLVFPSGRKLILVHGCFWHRHRCKKGRSTPKTRPAFWIKKLEGNKTRDAANHRKLRRLGWDVLTVWECQIRDADKLKERLVRFLRD